MSPKKVLPKKRLSRAAKVSALVTPFVTGALMAILLYPYWGVIRPALGFGQSQPVPTVPIPTIPSTFVQPLETAYLTIESIGVAAPIIEQVDGANEDEYLLALQKGVAHYEGTALVGQKGNAFLFGHSSYYRKKPGEYKQVFKKLNQVPVGGTIAVTRGTETYQYRVTASRIIEPTDVSVLAQPTDSTIEMVTIMTCWPPGTLNKRYILQAERIF